MTDLWIFYRLWYWFGACHIVPYLYGYKFNNILDQKRALNAPCLFETVTSLTIPLIVHLYKLLHFGCHNLYFSIRSIKFIMTDQGNLSGKCHQLKKSFLQKMCTCINCSTLIYHKKKSVALRQVTILFDNVTIA